MSMDLASNNSSEDDDADDANAMSFEASNRRSKINVEKELVIAAKLFIPIRPLILLCRAAAVVLCGIIVIVIVVIVIVESLLFVVVVVVHCALCTKLHQAKALSAGRFFLAFFLFFGFKSQKSVRQTHPQK